MTIRRLLAAEKKLVPHRVYSQISVGMN